MTVNHSHEQLNEDGLAQGLNKRHIRMIAIGGAIGVGLFLGSGKGISYAGPAVIGVYAVTGVFIFIIMRALGELLMYRPVTGSFAEYAREFLGPFVGFVTGWGYWFTWTIIGMAEITAAGIFAKFWFPEMPQYLTALIALIAIVILNLAKVGFFGEAEFWFASIKVIAIVSLIGSGIFMLVFRVGSAGKEGSITNLWDHGGMAPHGLLAVLLAFQIVVFSYQGVELIGMTAAEAKDRENVLPKAINSIPWRIGVFYVGTLIVLLSLFPWTQFGPTESPFVKGFTQIGLPAAASIMNFVVLASALSSCSAGLYSNGRLLKKLASDGLAPKRFEKTNRGHVPAAAIIASGALMLVGVAINAVVPEKAFSYISSVATLGAIWSWGVILVCHLRYRRRVEQGEVTESSFKLPYAKPLCWSTLAFLGGVLVLLAFDESQRIALYALPVWAVLFAGGYYFSSRSNRSGNQADDRAPRDDQPVLQPRI
ncbi:D-serine/D-alanine/glycine transporter [Rhodococcus wratislaviensis]|uniref:D-serine/D-alanine/glycine transporter n=1 Tax=Rhodococcus wratislaviensis TaxID=44752 RepID=A0A402C2W9_RHOWR|nr:amino acid permease [Rhodococcus wratislaviensis]GCE37916.1 D-serine/D-alanine/glycine transporter [Rhodococcus wratislaviensis]